MPSIDVLDSTIHYEVSGDAPVVYLHGNPTSSHAWRHVLPRTGGVAPDLIGMGRSGKPDIAYSFADHARYLDAFLDLAGLDEVVLVGHDWGGALAFDWAARHPERVRGIAFFETIVKPLSWDEYPPVAQERFKGFRAPGVGERKILEENIFITEALHATTLTSCQRRGLRGLRGAVPDGGEPAAAAGVAAGDADRRRARRRGRPRRGLRRLPGAEPGPEAAADLRRLADADDQAELTAWCEANMAALEVVHCGPAGHLALEDQPEAIGDALVAWFSRTLGAPSRRSVPALGR